MISLGTLMPTAISLTRSIPAIYRAVKTVQNIEKAPLYHINTQLHSEGVSELTIAEFKKLDKDAVNKLKHDVAKALLSRYALPWIRRRGGKPKHVDLIINFACFVMTMIRGKRLKPSSDIRR